MRKNTKDKSEKKLLFDENFPIGLGCNTCSDIDICGGINTPFLFDCLQLCCNNPSKCDYICPKDIENFIYYVTSIRGFDFDNIPKSEPLDYKVLPQYVPLIYNSSSRIDLFEFDTIAIQLSRLFDYDKEELRFQSKEELSDFFGFSPNANIVFSGVREDIPLEKYWFMRKLKKFANQLTKLQPILVTTPNFSSFSNAPRWDNLFNMKRIGICWAELVGEGIPASLHLNGRTLRDWERLTEFIIKRPEVKSISFEFATLYSQRKSWYVDRLIELSTNVKRDLQLVIRGGFSYFKTLNKSYKNLIYVDTDAFIRTIKRSKVQGENNNLSVASPDFYFVDELLKHNVEKRSAILKQKIKH